MKKSQLRFLVLSAVLIVVCVGLNSKWGSIPPLAKFLNPFQGFWRSGWIDDSKKTKELHFTNLKGPVEILWDVNGIPHFKAENLDDLYFAQGYVTASTRLFQMDLQARIATGELSELVGSKAEVIDQKILRLGMREAVRRESLLMMSDPVTASALTEYARGVNAYIDTLTEKDYPVEYKAMAAAPRRWGPDRTAALLKFMTLSLAGSSQDLNLTQYMKKWGAKAVEEIFPVIPYNVVPIVGEQSIWKKLAKAPAPPKDLFVTSIDTIPDLLKPAPWNGSNNWAVGPKKSKSGYSMVSNDTHLQYSLPSLWYEQQLMAPNLNVYGVTLPGTPGVVIGFNSKVAWAVTNATFDGMDYLEMKLRKNETDSGWEYLFENEWRKVDEKIEIYKVTKNSFQTDSKQIVSLWTHLGVLIIEPVKVGENLYRSLALQWVGHLASNPFPSFMGLNKAQNIGECEAALVGYKSPGQNFICADAQNISITPSGMIPLKWWQEGRYIGDGTKKEYAWTRWISESERPRSRNPSSGMVFSANENPVDTKYPYYLNWDYADSYRAGRIQEFIRGKEKLDHEDFRALQNDVLNTTARISLPLMLKKVDRSALAGPEIQMLDRLDKWDFVEDAQSVETTLFHEWWDDFEKRVWFDELGPQPPSNYPHVSTLEKILIDGESKWIDDIRTTKKETLSELLTLSWQEALKQIVEKFGSDSNKWQWNQVRPLKIDHLARIPGFGLMQPIAMGGSAKTVNANKANHGAVWRMIVELGPEVHAWGNFPGGSTGNPLDPNFDRYVLAWSKGELRALEYLSEENLKIRMKTPQFGMWEMSK